MTPQSESKSGFLRVALVIGAVLITIAVVGLYLPLVKCPTCDGTGTLSIKEKPQDDWQTFNCWTCTGKRRLTLQERLTLRQPLLSR